MTSVLFVDDDPAVLRGLEISLRHDRMRWQLVFVVGAVDAMRELERTPFDVVITDLSMPGMSGADLLAHVRDTHPTTARIILTGNAERTAFDSIGSVAHEVLGKPCGSAELRACIERALQSQVAAAR